MPSLIASASVVRHMRRCLCIDAELGLRRRRLVPQRTKPQQMVKPPPLEGPIARVAKAAVARGAAEELKQEYSNTLDFYKGQDGFLGACLLVDQEGKTAHSITMWQAVSDLDACTQHPQYGAMMAKLATHFLGVPDAETHMLSTRWPV